MKDKGLSRKLTNHERERIAYQDLRLTQSALNSKSTSKIIHVRKTALLLLEAQERLADVAHRPGSLNENNRDVTALAARIKNYKSSLEQVGHDPEQAVKWALAARKEYLTRKQQRDRPQRQNGLGMYNLGNSLKVWK